MELSSLDSTQSPPKSNNNVMDTPRTSNLKFLRAKRLNYFCEKSSQNPLSKTEESQNVGQTMKTATPRRCLSASTSNHVTADNYVPKKVNAEATTMSPNREKSLDATEEAKPPSSTSPQDKHANPGKDHLTDSPAPRTLHLTTTEMEVKEHTKHHNLQSVAEISCEPNKSIPNSLQLKISNPPVPSLQHSLQPVTKKKAKDMLTQHGLQEALEKSGGNVLFADNILQSSDKEPKIKGSPIYYDPLDTPKQVKERKYLSTKTESDEVEVLSTHRNLLRSSFVTDLDQDYLEDLSVPEREKLQHVMTWAKKFLDKCGDGKLISRNGDTLSKNMDEDISFECTGSSRVTDKYLKLNSVVFDECEFKKHPCIGDEPMESAPGQLLKSPRSLYKPKSKSKTAQLDSFLAEPTSNFRHCDHKEVDSFSASPCSVFPKLVKNMDVKNAFNIKGDDSLGEQFFDSTKQGHMHSDDLFGIRTKPNQSHFNTHTFKDTKPGPALKDSSIDREEDSSSPDSCLDTERLNILLEDLEWIEKDLKKTGENDGARTDRTFLVKNNAQDDDCTYISVSGKIPDSLQPALPRVESSSSLSESYTRKIYHMCPACGFTNTTSSNWCTECGSAFKRAKKQPMVNNRSFELSKPHIDDRAAYEIFRLNPQRKSFANNAVSKQNATELGRAVCWEDNSDVASDSEGSVLEKYFFYVKQLDMLRSQEKENPTKHFQEQHNSETSSDDESSDDYSIPRVRSGPAKPWGEPETLGTDPYRLGDQAMKEDSLKGFSEHINGNEGSNLKGLLDRKLQKVPDISSKVTGPRRYWEKSSIAWSSYTHGELKPRSRHSIQRPTSADLKKNKNQTQADNATEINAASKVERFIQKENNCTANATEYKNVAVAYMTTSNAWAVSEHLCKNKWEMSTQNHRRMCEGENSSVWLLLPDELWIYIFSRLPHGDLSRVARVCQRFRYIANDNSLWKVIKVTNCHSLEDSSLVSIGLHHPESISLYRCHDDRLNITDAGFRKLFQHCKDSLKKLNITNCSGEIFKGDSVLSYASNYCTRLISVDISWTGATDKGIISLVQACTCLQSLSMNGCNITDNAITALLKRHCKSLIKLEIFGCHALTAKCLTSVATECVHLENLNIGRIPKATDVCLAKIASNLHKITTLNLTGLNVVRDRAVHHIVKQCSKLESLSLSSCLQVTDVSLVEISTYRTTIKYLDLSGCKKVSDIGVQALARSCLQLRYLDLSSTSTGKRGVCLLASYCYATLECLKLSFCKEVTADAIEKLCKNCKRLKVLHLYGCRVSPDLGYLKKFSKSFQILHDLSIPTANILGE